MNKYLQNLTKDEFKKIFDNSENKEILEQIANDTLLNNMYNNIYTVSFNDMYEYVQLCYFSYYINDNFKIFFDENGGFEEWKNKKL